MIYVLITLILICVIIVSVIKLRVSGYAAFKAGLICTVGYLSLLVVFEFTVPRSEILTTASNTPQFFVDTKAKELYTEDQDGIQHFYGGEEFNLKRTIPFFESSKVKEPVVETKVEREYDYDPFVPFKMKSEVKTTVKRVLIPLNYDYKKEPATIKITP